MSANNTFTKENLDLYLKELAKEFRKRNETKVPAEIILVGGAAVLANYGFRQMTYDIDAIITASSSMKEAINAVGDKLNLPNGWLNTDFKKTSSYSPHLYKVSTYYKTYSNVLQIRTIKAEYLVAMKLKSGRKYKKDLSDIVGILMEQEIMNDPLTFERINKAVLELYGNWDGISEYTRVVLEKSLETTDLERLFSEQKRKEAQSKDSLKLLLEKDEVKATTSNVDEILEMIENRRLLQLAESRKNSTCTSFEDFVAEEGFTMEELDSLAEHVEIE